MVNALLRYMHARHCLDFGLACIYGLESNIWHVYHVLPEVFAVVLNVEPLKISLVLLIFSEAKTLNLLKYIIHIFPQIIL